MPPYLYINAEEDFWEDDTNDEPGRGMSGWLTNPTDGAFRFPYRPDFKFGAGDYTIVHSFNALASGGTRVATYDDYTTNDGVRMSQISDVFTIESGDVTVTMPNNPLDGQNHYLLVEREAGLEVRAYLDDFDVITASANDGGIDISNTEPLDIGYDGVTYMDGMTGVLILFDRLLEDYERYDLYFWIDSGYLAESEPVWVRDEAVLYINPNDLVQRAEYAANEALINLGLTVPDEIYVRYDFTSVDGISNPVLSYNDVRFSNLQLHRQPNIEGYDRKPFVRLELGHGESPQAARFFDDTTDEHIVVPLEELGDTWVNNDFTLTFWAKIMDTGAERYLISQGTVNAGDGWDLRYTVDDRLFLGIGGATAIFPASPIGQQLLEKYSMVTIRRAGNDFELFIDGQSVASNTSAVTVTAMTSDLLYGGAVANNSADSLLGPLHIWTRGMSDSEIAALYNEAPEANYVLGTESMSFTDGFSTQDLNWERL